MSGQALPAELRAAALHALQQDDAQAKVAAVQRLDSGGLVDPLAGLQPSRPLPGRPARPELVAPAKVRQRSLGSAQGRAALVHALAHIEFNAINLALDIMWRFAGMPPAFYRQWATVAAEEAMHFGLLCGHLRTLGHAYGDFPAHDGLWDMAEKTSGDLLARLALVPRTLEARGLDASPLIREKLAQAGDAGGAAILDIILRDEIGHVAVGNHWFGHLCRERGEDPVLAYARVAARYDAPRPKGPFNLQARRAAGFTEAELQWLLQEQARAPG
ncbi:ferritin-like domain-containing protein [Orrella sp. JC864]|uniref:ferritin-like domain-containing protein n=1 Tax=Orrella sp. JC864 TaxID=3120298 RepID=UPI0012BCF948